MYEASQELAYLDNVIQESLRLYPPAPRYIIIILRYDCFINFLVHRTFRLCLKTTVIKGVTIPQGATVVVPCSLLQRDPLYWRDPDKFDPDRYESLFACS